MRVALRGAAPEYRQPFYLLDIFTSVRDRAKRGCRRNAIAASRKKIPVFLRFPATCDRRAAGDRHTSSQPEQAPVYKYKNIKSQLFITGVAGATSASRGMNGG